MERWIETERFVCVDDDGAQYEVVMRQKEITFRPISGQPQKMKGIKDIQLSNGEHVNYIDDTTFKIVRNDKIIRKV